MGYDDLYPIKSKLSEIYTEALDGLYAEALDMEMDQFDEDYKDVDRFIVSDISHMTFA